MENVHVSDNELSHWGIKGMRWGIRRYQNKDGSLTPAGKKRRAKLESELKTLDGKSDSEAKPKTKTPKEMTTDELREAVNRLQLEKQYRDYYRDLNPKKVNNGKKYVERLLSSAVDGMAEGGKALIRDALIKRGKEALGLNPNTGKEKSKKDKLQEEHDYLDLQRRVDNLKSGYQKTADRAAMLENQKKIAVAEEWLEKNRNKKSGKSGG